MGGAAPAVDSSGHLWVSTGNGSVHSPGHAYDDSDSVLELSSSLRLLQFFAPGNWAANNAQDLDMSTEPALLPDGQVILAGKSRIVYLLNGAHLGGIGGQQAALGPACGEDIDGGSAVVGMTVYLPCFSGIIAVRAARSPPALRLLWTSGTDGGPPIVAAGLVWTIGRSGTLYGLDPATGRVRQQAPIGVPANHFPTPSVGDGLLLAASAEHVVAFTASARASPGPASPATSRPVTTPGAAATTPPGSQARGRRRPSARRYRRHRGRRPGGDRRGRLAAVAAAGRRHRLARRHRSATCTRPPSGGLARQDGRRAPGAYTPAIAARRRQADDRAPALRRWRIRSAQSAGLSADVSTSRS